MPGIDYDQFKVTVLGESTYIRDGARIHALDGTEGNLRWSSRRGKQSSMRRRHRTEGVYLRTYGGIHALDEATGDEIWSFEGTYSFANDITPGIANPLLVEEGVLAVPEVRGALHGLDAGHRPSPVVLPAWIRLLGGRRRGRHPVRRRQRWLSRARCRHRRGDLEHQQILEHLRGGDRGGRRPLRIGMGVSARP